MKIVLDVNVLLSALIKDSTTRNIIVKSDLDFYFPEPSLNKIRKYQNYIIEKSGLSETEYFLVLQKLFNFIKLVSKEQIIENWKEAKRIMEHIDSEDVVFIATALGLENSIIWSNDEHFQNQKEIKIWKTKDLVDLVF